MATGSYDVLLRPFREVAKYGQLGQARAQRDLGHHNHLALRTAAKALSNEGERALKKIAPLLLHPTAEFSDFLLDLALHQDDVTAKFRDIDTALYDFEDFIDLESFEKDKFDYLQTEVKAIAILILDKIRRHTAESSLDGPISPKAFAPLPRQPSVTKLSNRPAPAAIGRPPSRARAQPPQPPQKPLPVSPPSASPPQQHPVEHPGANGPGAKRHVANFASRQPPSAQESSWYAEDQQNHRPYDHHPQHQGSTFEVRHAVDNSHARHELAAHQRPISPESVPSAHQSLSSSTFSPIYYRGSVATSIPENDLPKSETDWLPIKQDYSVTTASVTSSVDQLLDRRHEASFQNHPYHYGRSRDPSQDAAPSTFDERQLVDRFEPVSPISDSIHTFGAAAPVSRVSSLRASSSSGSSKRDTDQGPVSIRSFTKVHSSSRGTLGSDSSFGMHKGFCRGAQRFLSEGPGSAVKKVGGQAGAASLNASTGGKDYEPEFHSMFSTPIGYTEPMAQCTSCEYKGNYSQLLQDMQQDPLTNQQSHGLRYRPRFLFKSHVVTRDLFNVYYACLFCAQLGQTCREGDATVFPSLSLLFRHLARHPLPLPEVPGLTVLYDGLERNQANAQDYDLHFPTPETNQQANVALDEAEADLESSAILPTARATKDHLQRKNEKPLSRPPPVEPALNALEVLQFMAGAKITHVDYPERWEGKWCRGRHDGVYGAFPSRLIELDPPRGLDMSNLPSSACNAMTKWKWEGKSSAAAPWLQLKKGERVYNITWDDVHAWYWIARNSQGKMGIFPKSHINIQSLNDGSHPDATARSTKSQGGFSSLFGRKR